MVLNFVYCAESTPVENIMGLFVSQTPEGGCATRVSEEFLWIGEIWQLVPGVFDRRFVS
jgi:hypothetical protein